MKQEKLVLTPFSGGSPVGLSLGARVRKEGSADSEGKKDMGPAGCVFLLPLLLGIPGVFLG